MQCFSLDLITNNDANVPEALCNIFTKFGANEIEILKTKMCSKNEIKMHLTRVNGDFLSMR